MTLKKLIKYLIKNPVSNDQIVFCENPVGPYARAYVGWEAARGFVPLCSTSMIADLAGLVVEENDPRVIADRILEFLLQ